MDALLSRYNDGRRKTLYCLAVNLLEPDDLKGDLRETESNPEPAALAPKERAAYMAGLLQKLAGKRDLCGETAEKIAAFREAAANRVKLSQPADICCSTTVSPGFSLLQIRDLPKRALCRRGLPPNTACLFDKTRLASKTVKGAPMALPLLLFPQVNHAVLQVIKRLLGSGRQPLHHLRLGQGCDGLEANRQNGRLLP